MSNAITDLFLKDPLQLQRSEFEEIIEHYRKQRANFAIASKSAGSTRDIKKLEKAKEIAQNLDLKLDDIDI